MCFQRVLRATLGLSTSRQGPKTLHAGKKSPKSPKSHKIPEALSYYASLCTQRCGRTLIPSILGRGSRQAKKRSINFFGYRLFSGGTQQWNPKPETLDSKSPRYAETALPKSTFAGPRVPQLSGGRGGEGYLRVPLQGVCRVSGS